MPGQVRGHLGEGRSTAFGNLQNEQNAGKVALTMPNSFELATL